MTWIDDFGLTKKQALAVLEKNKEIAKEVLKLSVSNTPSWLQIRKDFEARAFRDWVSGAEKRRSK